MNMTQRVDHNDMNMNMTQRVDHTLNQGFPTHGPRSTFQWAVKMFQVFFSQIFHEELIFSWEQY